MGHLSIQRLATKFSFPEKEIRKKLISKKMGVMDDKSFIPTKKALKERIAIEKDGDDGAYVYYVFDTEYIASIVPKKSDPLLFAGKYNHAAKNIEILYTKLVNKKAYFHTFKYEIERAIESLEELGSTSQIDKKRIAFNVSKLRSSRSYMERDMNDFIF